MSENHFDKASRLVAKLDPAGVLRWLIPGLSPTLTFRQWLDTRSIPFPGEPDRTGDTVACLHDAGTGEWWAIALEFMAEAEAEMFGRMLEYHGRLWRERRPTTERGSRYAVAGVVVNLTGVGHTSQDMVVPTATALRTCLEVGERDLEREDAASVLTEVAAGRQTRCLLPWIPLMIGGGDAGIIEEWKRQVAAEPDPRRQGELAGLAWVYALLARRRELWREAVEGWNVRQSEAVLEWQAEASARMLLRLLALRFPPGAPEDLATTIQRTTDNQTLERWFDAAYNARSLEEFRGLVEQGAPSPNGAP
jgi:hypothetical protein